MQILPGASDRVASEGSRRRHGVGHDPPSGSPPAEVPLRLDFLVRLTLPVDLTTTDADMLAAFVRALAFTALGATTDSATGAEP